MNQYERLLKIMQKESRKTNPEEMSLAYVSGGHLKVGNLTLDKDDYMIAENVVLEDGDMVLVYPIEDNQYIAICKVVSA